jgi:hypothetical protein
MTAVLSLRDRLSAGVRPIVEPTNLSAPVKGWNTRDALDAMDPLDAVQLDNFYPDAGGVGVRNGYTLFASGLGSSSPVQTLAEYDAGATDKFLAASGGFIYNVSTGTPTALNISPFSVNAWQTANFLSKLFFCNGTDTMQVFDGTTLANAAFTGGSTPNLNTIIGVALYQQRLFFWQKNSTGFWYAQLNSINGALAFFDLSAFCSLGGNLTAVTTFSYDGGNGVQDMIVFIMSSGQALIYFGNDPSSAVSWALIGIYRISPPVNIRSVCNYGAEAFLTTYDDHVPLSQQLTSLKLGQLPPRSKVSNAVQAAVTANANALGWQALFYPKGRRLIFNIPNPDGTFDQHVMNTGNVNLPWCRFVNMNAICFGLFENNLYFGDALGNVWLADSGSLDDTGPIAAIGQQAWNTFNSPYRKQVTGIRPLVQVFESAAYEILLGFDYGDFQIPITAVTGGVGSPWNVSPWNTSPWSGEGTVNARWSGGGGNGTAIGIQLVTTSTQPVTWLRTDLIYQPGDYL